MVGPNDTGSLDLEEPVGGVDYAAIGMGFTVRGPASPKNTARASMGQITVD